MAPHIQWILIYLASINIIGFAFMYIDKAKAKRHAYRIPEKRLFIIAFLGGGIGCVAGMQYFRHKTKHAKFVWGMPLITIAEYALLCYLLFQI